MLISSEVLSSASGGVEDMSAISHRVVVLFSRAGLLAVLLCLSLWPALSSAGTLSAFRIVSQDTLRLHLDFDSAVSNANLFTLDNPDRLVIDLPGTSLASSLSAQTFADGLVQAVRYGLHGDKGLRVVVDLREAVSPSFRFLGRQSGQRLLIDLGVPGTTDNQPVASRAAASGELRDVIVAIDAGHGGKDPGAIGQRKTREKDITLAISRQLYAYLNAQPGIQAVLTREDDTYVGLRTRIERASEASADLFVSIHADAVLRRSAAGSSVYALSLDGASSELAARLAQSENETAALFGDVALGGLEKHLRQTLLDLAQSSTMESSLEAGNDVLDELKKLGPVHKPNVEQAAFVVLKSPDIPSLLIETAFISNLEEEKKLRSKSHQQKLSRAIGKGITRYLTKRAPHGTRIAAARGSVGTE